MTDSTETIAYSKSIPLVGEFDVIVVGGGPAGIMAAIAAATNGSTTLLIERYGFVGGSLTNSLVAPCQVFSVFGKPIVGGFPRELMERLESGGNAIFPALDKTHGDWRGLTYWDPEVLGVRFDPEALKSEALQMLLETDVKIRFHTTVVDYMTHLNTLVTHSKSGYQAFKASIIVDCSGDGDVAAMAQCDFRIGKSGDRKALQPPTLMMLLGGVNYETASRFRPSFPYLIRRATENGDLSLKREDLLFYRGTVKKGQCIVNCSRIYRKDGTDVDDLVLAEIEGRKQNLQLLEFFRKYIPGFESCHLLQMASQVGIRETRRITGKYTLTGEDVLSGREFSDTIALSYWPIDQHRSDAPGTILEFPGPGVVTRIPYRCLVPNGCSSLVVAGRAISTTREAFASIRVSATAMALGQAAGTAAALAVQNNVKIEDVPVDKLVHTLKMQGAILSY